MSKRLKDNTPYNVPSNNTYFWNCVVVCMSLCVCLLGSITKTYAQASSLNTFSPYTMYGLGDMSVGGSSFNRSMAGVGVAQRSTYQFNYLNPASMSAIPRNTAIFNVGADGKNFYSSKGDATTSFNTFNLHDLALAFPLGNKIGLGFSMTPVSSVGYLSRIVDNDQSITENIGSSVYNYAGDGGVSQVAMNLGVQVARGLSLGASLNYWFGNINRQYGSVITPLISSASSYRNILSIENQNISRILFTLGAQYSISLGEQGQYLTLGATYQPKVSTSIKKNLTTLSYNDKATDTVASSKTRWDMDIPSEIAAGIFFNTRKFTVGFDYSRQDWTGAYEMPKDQNVSLGTQQEFKFGLSYTPDIYDIRSAMKRWTYKVGVRYSDNYLIYNGRQLKDAAVSMGVDFSLKQGSLSRVGIGVEYGERGSSMVGMVRERYFNIFASFSLFGEGQYWFRRPKYN